MAGRFSFELTDESGNTIDMEEAVKGRQAEVYQFKFGVGVSVDKATSKITGHREYKPLTIVKPICKASPIIFQKLCEGKKLKTAKVTLYRHDPVAGDEKEFYRYILEDVSIVSHAPLVADTTNDSTKYLPPLEEIQIIAERVTQIFVDGNIEYTDEYRNKKVA